MTDSNPSTQAVAYSYDPASNVFTVSIGDTALRVRLTGDPVTDPNAKIHGAALHNDPEGNPAPVMADLIARTFEADIVEACRQYAQQCLDNDGGPQTS